MLAGATLPVRVRQVLLRLHALLADELGSGLEATLVALDKRLFDQASQSRSNEHQADLLAEMQVLRRHRNDLVPAFTAALDARLAGIREPAATSPTREQERLQFVAMTLVEDKDMDRDIVLREIARRETVHARTPLQLLGQRFGVLAGSPAFDADALPVGPQALCSMLGEAGDHLQLSLTTQLQLYREFEREVMAGYGKLVKRINELLSEEGILPGLVEVAVRISKAGTQAPRVAPDPAAQANAQSPAYGHGPGPGRASDRGGGHGAPPPLPAARPLTNWHSGAAANGDWSRALAGALDGNEAGMGGGAVGSAPAGTGPAGFTGLAGAADAAGNAGGAAEADPGMPADGAGGDAPAPAWHAPAPAPSGFSGLQELLSGRRTALAARGESVGNEDTRVINLRMPTAAVLSTLGTLQAQEFDVPLGKRRRRSMQQLRESLVQRVRDEHGEDAGLSQEDADTFDLLDLLYGEIEREVQPDAPAIDLLVRLQVPVARAAVQDRGFFVRERHPARELLNAVAESGATWLADDDADPQLVARLQQAVEKVVTDYDGDESVFEAAHQDVQGHYRAMARKAELAERRHVEAARGKDRLETAKQMAASTIAEATDGRSPPKFVRALLNQAWADVLTLTLLRQGEDSAGWKERRELTARIVAQTSAAPGHPADAVLAGLVESALLEVGYHADEATAIARRLSSDGANEEDGASRTELTARLKARARLGEQSETRRAPKPVRSDEEQACYDELRLLPFGSWFEFVLNQQGDVRRQRLSWFSPITDNALFVNQRGQRIGEHSLDGLARLMARGQARVVTEDRGRLIDRAWQATVRALRSIAGSGAAKPTVEIP